MGRNLVMEFVNCLFAMCEFIVCLRGPQTFYAKSQVNSNFPSRPTLVNCTYSFYKGYTRLYTHIDLLAEMDQVQHTTNTSTRVQVLDHQVQVQVQVLMPYSTSLSIGTQT